jgi:hypothetical protein
MEEFRSFPQSIHLYINLGTPAFFKYFQIPTAYSASIRQCAASSDNRVTLNRTRKSQQTSRFTCQLHFLYVCLPPSPRNILWYSNIKGLQFQFVKLWVFTNQAALLIKCWVKCIERKRYITRLRPSTVTHCRLVDTYQHFGWPATGFYLEVSARHWYVNAKQFCVLSLHRLVILKLHKEF